MRPDGSEDLDAFKLCDCPVHGVFGVNGLDVRDFPGREAVLGLRQLVYALDVG